MKKILVIIFCLAAGVFLLQTWVLQKSTDAVVRQAVTVPSNPSMAKDDKVSLVSQEHTIEEAAVTLPTAAVKATATPSKVIKPPLAEALPQESPAAIVTVNPVPTDEEIIASIKLQNQQRETMQKMLADREAKAAQVIDQVKMAPKQDPSKTNVVVETAPRDVAPGDIIEKLKSSTLVAH